MSAEGDAGAVGQGPEVRQHGVPDDQVEPAPRDPGDAFAPCDGRTRDGVTGQLEGRGQQVGLPRVARDDQDVTAAATKYRRSRHAIHQGLPPSEMGWIFRAVDDQGSGAHRARANRSSKAVQWRSVASASYIAVSACVKPWWASA